MQNQPICATRPLKKGSKPGRESPMRRLWQILRAPLLSQEDPGKEPHIKDTSPLPPKRAPCFFLPRCPPLSHSGALAFAPPLASSFVTGWRIHLAQSVWRWQAFDGMKMLIRDGGGGDGPIAWSLEGYSTCRRAWKTLRNMGSWLHAEFDV